MSQPLKFLLIPMGSAGDVHPFVYLAKLLQSRGHEVLMLAQDIVRQMPEAAGISTIAWGNAEEQGAIIRNPDLWHPGKAFPLIASLLPQIAADTIPLIRQHVDPGRTILIGGALAFGARIAAERWNIPLLTVHLQPSIFMSVDHSPVLIAPAEWLPKSPRFVRRAFFALGNWRVDQLLSPGISKVRASVGLPPGRIKGILRTYWHSPDGVLCLFPDFFAPKAPDWPQQAVLTRFPLYDESDTRTIDPALETFLAQGTPPVIITPGSANAHAHTFLRNAVEACQLTGRRALVVTRYPEQVGPLPPDAASFDYIPFGRVFPHAAAIIHHGGIGTTAQTLAAGTPHLIMPMAHDQPDNAARIKKMALGDYLYPRAFKPARIAKTLNALLTSPAVKSACALYQQKMQTQMPDAQVTQIIESLAHRALHLRRTTPLITPEAAAAATRR